MFGEIYFGQIPIGSVPYYGTPNPPVPPPEPPPSGGGGGGTWKEIDDYLLPFMRQGRAQEQQLRAAIRDDDTLIEIIRQFLSQL